MFGFVTGFLALIGLYAVTRSAVVFWEKVLLRARIRRARRLAVDRTAREQRKKQVADRDRRRRALAALERQKERLTQDRKEDSRTVALSLPTSERMRRALAGLKEPANVEDN